MKHTTCIFLFIAVPITAVLDINRVVNHINEYRRLHQSPPLIYSTTISEFSQSWADYMSINQVFQHSKENMYGENIALAYYTDTDTDTLIKSIDMFYNEVLLYDYNNPVFNSETGHFTQLVWMNTREIGLGIATSTNGYTYICTNYNPSGNYMGQFQINVKPSLSQPHISTIKSPSRPKLYTLSPPPRLSPPLIRHPPYGYPVVRYTISIKYPSTDVLRVNDVLCPEIERFFDEKCIIYSKSRTGIYYGVPTFMDYGTLSQIIEKHIDDFTKSTKLVCGSTITLYLNEDDLFRYTASKFTCVEL